MPATHRAKALESLEQAADHTGSDPALAAVTHAIIYVGDQLAQRSARNLPRVELAPEVDRVRDVLGRP